MIVDQQNACFMLFARMSGKMDFAHQMRFYCVDHQERIQSQVGCRNFDIVDIEQNRAAGAFAQ